jgi:hypothetical protein
MPLLQSMAVVVEKRHLRPALSIEHQSWDIPSSTNCFDGGPKGWLVSVAYAIMSLINAWVAQLAERRNLTLRIHDGCYQELSINPKKYRYVGPMWLARLIGILFPPPDLWILLDISEIVLQPSSQEFLSTDTLRQREAYRTFVKTRERYIILDAGRPFASVVEEAYAAIIKTLALCTDEHLRNRF